MGNSGGFSVFLIWSEVTVIHTVGVDPSPTPESFNSRFVALAACHPECAHTSLSSIMCGPRSCHHLTSRVHAMMRIDRLISCKAMVRTMSDQAPCTAGVPRLLSQQPVSQPHTPVPSTPPTTHQPTLLCFIQRKQMKLKTKMKPVRGVRVREQTNSTQP